MQRGSCSTAGVRPKASAAAAGLFKFNLARVRVSLAGLYTGICLPTRILPGLVYSSLQRAYYCTGHGLVTVRTCTMNSMKMIRVTGMSVQTSTLACQYLSVNLY